MLQFIVTFSIMIMSFVFTQMKHPLAIGLMLLIQTFLVCLMTGMMIETFWFSYILFLVFLGGMLVLFIYVTSLASNEMFSLSMKLFIISFLLFGFMTFITLFLDKSIFTLLNNNDTLTLLDLNLFIKENSLNLNKLYNYPTNFITLLLINYLFFTLVVVVKVTNFYFGPLRQMN